MPESPSLPTVLAFVVLLSVGFVAMLYLAAWRVRTGGPFVPFRPRRPVPWTGPAVLAGFLLLVASEVLLSQQADRWWPAPQPPRTPWTQDPPAGAGPHAAPPSPSGPLRVDAAGSYPWAVHVALQTAVDASPAWAPAAVAPAGRAAMHAALAPQRSYLWQYAHVQYHRMLAMCLAKVGAMLVMLLALATTFRATCSDLGCALRGAARDMRHGAIAFLGIMVPIYGLHLLMHYLVPYHHPLMDLLRERTPQGVLLSAASAVLIAPLQEEFFFRVLLQGWLEQRLARFPAPPAGGGADEASPISPPVRGLPIVVSSAVFAAMHTGQGAAPIPLFFFSLALGYLYQRTHRLWAPVALHGCLNAFSLSWLLLAGG
jgi:membrane protease YdiL (CAAX protease family)